VNALIQLNVSSHDWNFFWVYWETSSSDNTIRYFITFDYCQMDCNLHEKTNVIKGNMDDSPPLIGVNHKSEAGGWKCKTKSWKMLKGYCARSFKRAVLVVDIQKIYIFIYIKCDYVCNKHTVDVSFPLLCESCCYVTSAVTSPLVTMNGG